MASSNGSGGGLRLSHVSRMTPSSGHLLVDGAIVRRVRVVGSDKNSPARCDLAREEIGRPARVCAQNVSCTF
uniref:Uncharacterized protein n=1 Tax=Triticum urartu TaxID=4572 RepID=A0A8R7U716_TRIUA